MFLKDRIIRHYDELSPFYKDVWGIHIHHGYWNTGAETKNSRAAQDSGAAAESSISGAVWVARRSS
jgi:hypothetical protein